MRTLAATFDGLSIDVLETIERAASEGPVRITLASDADIMRSTGAPPRLPEAERRYLAESIRWVDEVVASGGDLAETGAGLECGEGVPPLPEPEPIVFVTGCYDWLHSGHVRFFEEASAFGRLHVTVGNDESVTAHKGPGHPLFAAEVRRYLVGAVRHVHRALVATGSGWLDAAPEMESLGAQVLIVNQDGDRPEKRDYCALHGIAYHVLERAPRPGLSRRSSTELRGY